MLVTGANGFLGRAVAAALDARGSRCAARRAVAPAAAAAGEAWIGYGDVGPETRWDGALAGIDAVVHLAGLAHLPDAMAAAAADTFARVNAEGTARLAAAAVAAGVRRLVLMSSALVHGEASPGRPFTEGDAPAPASPYARSKLDSERRLMAAARGSRPAMGDPAAADGLWRGRARQLPPPRQLVRTRVPLPLGAATAPRELHRHRQPGRRRGACVEHPRAANQVFLLADAEATSTADLVRRIAAALGPPRVDAVRAGGIAADRARGWPDASATTAPVRSARARHQPHPHPARLVAAGDPGGGPPPRREAE